MNLPHLEPLLFAKEILQVDDSKAEVLCEFSTIPTLSMFIEAAAQSSAAFNNQEEDPKIGFLTTVKSLKLLEEPEETSYFFHLNIVADMGNIKQFNFIAVSKDITTVKGTFTIFVP